MVMKLHEACGVPILGNWTISDEKMPIKEDCANGKYQVVRSLRRPSLVLCDEAV